MKRIRITLDLTRKQSDKLKELEDDFGESKAEIIRNALRFYAYAAGRMLAGDKFQIVGKDNTVADLVFLTSAGVLRASEAETTELDSSWRPGQPFGPGSGEDTYRLAALPGSAEVSPDDQTVELRRHMSQPYTVVLTRDDEGDVIARIPELPGCVAHDVDEAGALRRLRSVQEQWISDCLEAGDPVPPPTRDLNA